LLIAPLALSCGPGPQKAGPGFALICQAMNPFSRLSRFLLSKRSVGCFGNDFIHRGNGVVKLPCFEHVCACRQFFGSGGIRIQISIKKIFECYDVGGTTGDKGAVKLIEKTVFLIQSLLWGCRPAPQWRGTGLEF
jgi:hypothetical protein